MTSNVLPIPAPGTIAHACNPTTPGWFAVASRSEWPAAGQVKSIHWMGRRWAFFQTERGQLGLLPPTCPHMGADMTVRAKVVGDTLQCPFHGFQFDASGACRKAGNSNPACGTWNMEAPLLHRDGDVLFAWNEGHHRTKAHWTPVTVAAGDWTPWTFHAWNDRTITPFNVAENGVDLLHFSELHGFHDARMEAPPQVEQHVMKLSYSAYRKGRIGRHAGVHVTFDIQQQGLGLALVVTTVQELGLRSRHLIMTTPTVDGRSTLRVASSVDRAFRARNVHALATLVPKRLLTQLVQAAVHKGFTQEVAEDLPIWENRDMSVTPKPAAGDGPVMLYRKWAAALNQPTS